MNNKNILIELTFSCNNCSGNDVNDIEKDLLQLTLSYIDRNECSTSNKMVPETSIVCAKRLDTSGCFFEIGGPLYDPLKKIVVGIASWDTTDCAHNSGLIFTRLSYSVSFCFCNL